MTLTSGTSYAAGNIYSFEITGEKELPPDNDVFYIMRGSDGMKHLLMKKYYNGYGLKKGSSIKCRVDKINCSGRVFFEPVHPCYEPGNTYDFVLNELREIVNSEGQLATMAVLADCMGKEVIMPVTSQIKNQTANTKVQCTVMGISKGKLLLAYPEEVTGSQLPEGSVEDFRVESVETRAEGEDYYKLIAADGSCHFLRKKYYASYHISIGDVLRCRVKSGNTLTPNYLEPVHPRYTPGTEAAFQFSHLKAIPDLDERGRYKIFVTDSDGQVHSVYCPGIDPLQLEPGQNIRCHISDIRYSKLILECIK